MLCFLYPWSMKRKDNLIASIADPDNLRLAFWKASKGKRHAAAVLRYQKKLDHNLERLRRDLLSGAINVGNYHMFTIFEPKERLICACAFSEQVLHHAVMNICHADFDKRQIWHSYASRVGRGVHAALKQAQHHQKRYGWFLKLDVKKFFETVHHDTLLHQLERLFKDRQLLEIFEKIIRSYEATEGRGLPIGNLTSQYFANHYLSGLDHFIKQDLKIDAYVRYMDDMVLWHSEKCYLKSCLAAINTYVEENLCAELKPCHLNRTATGLTFLGYHIFPNATKLSQQSKKRFRLKIKAIEQKIEQGVWTERIAQRHVLPLINFTEYAYAKSFRKYILLQNNGFLL